MTFELLSSLLLFAFVSSITPGPNNLMLMASGANFGFRRSIGHLLGVGAGFILMIILVGVGLMQVFERYPTLELGLKIVSVLYLIYLAWKIATAAPPERVEAAGRPITFLQAAAFQWVNPKAWAMAMAAITLYAPSRSLEAVLVVAGAFALVNWPCISFWNLLGRELRRFLKKHTHIRIFNGVMAVLLLLSLAPMAMGVLGQSG